MNNQNKTKKQVIGDIGEDLSCKFLKNKGFRIVGRNYWRKWGEIDIIVEKDNILRFIEVKTVSRENISNVPCETNKDEYRAEDNLHKWKLKRLSRVIQTYLIDENIKDNQDWRFDVITVSLDLKGNKARINFIEDIIL